MGFRLLLTGFAIVCLGSWARGLEEEGLVGRWDFDEGSGPIAHDTSGQGNHGQLHGPIWVQQGSGYALSFDGVNDYVDCGNRTNLDLTEAVSLEAWVNPGALPAAEPMIVGKYYDSYGLTYYKDGNLWFYISGGGNHLSGRLEIGVWSHVVATFDGTTMTLYINGEKVASKQSKASTIASGKNFWMGVLRADSSAQGLGYSIHWRGRLDRVRVYNRPLSEEEVFHHYKQAAGEYGVDTTWFDRLRVVLYPFRAEQRLLALWDGSGIFPRSAEARLEVFLVRKDGTEVAGDHQEFPSLPPSGQLCSSFSLADLPPGNYAVRGRLTGPKGLDLQGESTFRHPTPPVEVPAPTQRKVGPLKPPPPIPPFQLKVQPGGGFFISMKGRSVPFESSFSYPYGGENRLLAGSPDRRGEATWQVTVRRGLSSHTRQGGEVKGHYEVMARGKFYSLQREILCYSNRILVRDTIRNETDEDLGILLDNALDATKQPYQDWALSGFPHAVRRSETQSPSVFVAWKDGGIGFLPLDDVYIVQSTVYAEHGRAGLLTDKFGLAARASYTLEWAIYLTATPDYYEFLNAVRRDEKRNQVTVEGGFAFIPREGISREEVERRHLLYASFGCLSNVADDPEIEIEGIDFLWLPRERARLRSEFEVIRKVNPHLKLMFHVAHSLISTNKPGELFPDSRVLDSQGNHVLYPYDYDACAYFSRQRHQEGWRWYIYYPTPGNSFHEALMQSVDVMVDDIGCNGAFMDGFFYGYGSPYTYDRWDGHTVEMDPETKTIKRKVGSVLLLSQPSMVEFTRRMAAKGAVVIANNVIQTRTISALPIIVDQECRSGPDVHLAQTPCALGNPTVIRNETDVYRDVLDKLKWGNLYFYYGEGNLTHPSLPQQMYPITVEEIHAGTIQGRERIVTMHSGIYGWRGSRELHLGYRYNPVGVPVPAEFLTTVDAAGVRTQVSLEPQESAVLKKIPVTLCSREPVNLVCEQYDAAGLALDLNGQGPVEVRVRNGDFPISPGVCYRISTSPQLLQASAHGLLRVPLVLKGPAQLIIRPDKRPAAP